MKLGLQNKNSTLFFSFGPVQTVRRQCFALFSSVSSGMAVGIEGQDTLTGLLVLSVRQDPIPSDQE